MRVDLKKWAFTVIDVSWLDGWRTTNTIIVYFSSYSRHVFNNWKCSMMFNVLYSYGQQSIHNRHIQSITLFIHFVFVLLRLDIIYIHCYDVKRIECNIKTLDSLCISTRLDIHTSMNERSILYNAQSPN
jgi:hypothetical protein